ncbi:MAG: hypothetical protein ABJN69_03310 [Hellea sp.]
MTYKTAISITAILLFSACQTAGNMAAAQSIKSDEDIATCIRTVMTLEEGRWNYMGTIAQVYGKFRTYEAVIVNAAAGDDMWSSKAFGGDVGGDEKTAELGYNKLIGTSLVSMDGGVPNEPEAHKIKSCVGPDPEGRYEIKQEYKMPNGKGGYVTAQNMTWYSEHGSYYAEDVYNEDGRITSRRSGVYTPSTE